MTRALVINPSSSIATQSDSPHALGGELHKRRMDLLRELRGIPEIIQAAKELNADEVYKIVSFPDGGQLYKDAAGNFKGVFYKDGKILEHTKFQAVRPSLVKAATAVGSQILLVSIAMQLNRIEGSIAKLFSELHNDRIAEINAGISSYEQALSTSLENTKHSLITNAISVLNTGLEKSIASLKQQIADAPDTRLGLFDNWKSNKSERSGQAFMLAQESFQACLLGIQTLANCYVCLGEPLAAANALRTYVEKLDSCDIAAAVKKARLAPAANGVFPELPWNSYIKQKSFFDEKISECEILANDEFERIEIEIKPKELLEA